MQNGTTDCTARLWTKILDDFITVSVGYGSLFCGFKSKKIKAVPLHAIGALGRR
jgi:hypothetical protein